MFHLFGHRFPGAKRRTHRVRNAVPRRSISARSSVDGEGVISMWPQVTYGDESFGRGLFDQSVVVVQIFQLE